MRQIRLPGGGAAARARQGRAGQGRAPLRRRRCAGAGPEDAEPRPCCAAPWGLLAAPYSRRRAAALEGSPRRAAPAHSLGGSAAAPALPARRCATGTVPGRASSRCRARRFRAGRRDWGASSRAARAGLTARPQRPRARAAPRRPHGGALPAGRAVPRKAPLRPRSVSARPWPRCTAPSASSAPSWPWWEPPSTPFISGRCCCPRSTRMSSQ